MGGELRPFPENFKPIQLGTGGVGNATTLKKEEWIEWDSEVVQSRIESSVRKTMDERMLKWFAFEHLPGHLQPVSQRFHAVALWLTLNVPAGPERTVALRKLLEAKDAAVRAMVHEGG